MMLKPTAELLIVWLGLERDTKKNTRNEVKKTSTEKTIDINLRENEKKVFVRACIHPMPMHESGQFSAHILVRARSLTCTSFFPFQIRAEIVSSGNTLNK